VRGCWTISTPALKRVTKNNPDLLLEYYRFYAHWKLTDEISRSSGNAGTTDRTIRRGGFTDINEGVLGLERLALLETDEPLLLLGETLIHEFAHTSHASDNLKGPGEGKAYGIENFLAERMGDTARDKKTSELGPKKGDQKAFNTAYRVTKQLYEVIDTGVSRLPSLKGVNRQRARELVVEFIARNRQDFSPELKKFIITELGQDRFDSLPSQETQ
jgi:hypothetical protein